MALEETVVVRTRTPLSTITAARGHEIVIDKPQASGGQDTGAMASEHLLAALGSCQVTTAHRIAAKRRTPVDAIAVTATAVFDGDLIDRIDLDVVVTGGPDDDEELETVFRLVERSCTISRALAVPVQRTVRRAEAGATDTG